MGKEECGARWNGAGPLEDVTTKTAQARAQVQNKDSIPNVPTFIASVRQGYISPESFRRCVPVRSCAPKSVCGKSGDSLRLLGCDLDGSFNSAVDHSLPRTFQKRVKGRGENLVNIDRRKRAIFSPRSQIEHLGDSR
ncbi:hypothetical protein Q8A67_014850 [Cirrhinus molitorella]|uniref:Uncharacterized protein n=1 Tax=Cirrhinus molitorella TaxID=172907 RepID=A0AA88PRA2_9TELE|nr:hypothetical protein Q8A67_014850 [Cirrhinus molitorella]